MEGMDKTDPKAIKRCQEDAFEQFMAYTYLDNSNREKYGSLMANSKQHQS